MINMLNHADALLQLPPGRVVEVPALVDHNTAQCPQPVWFPEKLAGIHNRVSNAHELAARAAVTGSLEILHEILETDPAIPECPDVYTVVTRLLETYKDILKVFFFS